MTEQDRWQEIEMTVENIRRDRGCVPEALRRVRGESDILAETVLGWLHELHALHLAAVRALEAERDALQRITVEAKREVNALCKERGDARAERDTLRAEVARLRDSWQQTIDADDKNRQDLHAAIGQLEQRQAERDAARQEVEQMRDAYAHQTAAIEAYLMPFLRLLVARGLGQPAVSEGDSPGRKRNRWLNG